ncbi:alkaline phosphatase family protein [Alteromonas halophila]|uniref:Alkaline phosphatase family protein n=1 Tax=Alteromonas halophila TaxID=516698 RepID=A0A918JNA7_9ALTE|nr:alkaline phosphatase family protein [Alteromonas halophila]GGW91910.1 hypothetical protein GCM10007391_27700 [Alteromonas halophila]
MSLPAVLAGPIVRRVTDTACHFWLVTRARSPITVTLHQCDQTLTCDTSIECIPIGTQAFIQLISVTSASPFIANEPVSYSFTFADNALQQQWQKEVSALCYDGHDAPFFRWTPVLRNVLHGSCRRPHSEGEDALVRLDELLSNSGKNETPPPDILLLTGDQIYADDVAGPTLQAVGQVIERLGLHSESLEGAVVDHSEALESHPFNYYQRDQLLPKTDDNSALAKLFFRAKRKPVFTSVNAKNHLITLSEVLAMYLLCWSPVLWRDVEFDESEVPDDYRQQFACEQDALTSFIDALPAVQRAMANIATYMMFDDHDVTDDWNLTRGWEEEVYSHPLSRRMVGNALVGYLLCQGWGNCPARLSSLVKTLPNTFAEDALQNQSDLIDTLFEFESWDYQLDTSPPVRVLDTRTRRWRSESDANKPSGLMDWEALCEFQNSILKQDKVIVVAPAPIFGVKFIEAIQKVFTFFGKALTVDAENWMAHKGTANVILNIFRHYRTPPFFIILSGDVHYSFVYDVKLRFRKRSPQILQFTCSGIKNTFPARLIRWLDRGNRWLYSPHSPLNVFTRRRDMTVSPRQPTSGGELHNGSALGQLILDEEGKEVACRILCSNGDTVDFPSERKRHRG